MWPKYYSLCLVEQEGGGAGYHPSISINNTPPPLPSSFSISLCTRLYIEEHLVNLVKEQLAKSSKKVIKMVPEQVWLQLVFDVLVPAVPSCFHQNQTGYPQLKTTVITSNE